MKIERLVGARGRDSIGLSVIAEGGDIRPSKRRVSLCFNV